MATWLPVIGFIQKSYLGFSLQPLRRQPRNAQGAGDTACYNGKQQFAKEAF